MDSFNINNNNNNSYNNGNLTNPPLFARALYYYPGDQPEDLTFEAGDLIEVYENDDPDWWRGKACTTGQYGAFPSALVEIVSAEEYQDLIFKSRYKAEEILPDHAPSPIKGDIQSDLLKLVEEVRKNEGRKALPSRPLPAPNAAKSILEKQTKKAGGGWHGPAPSEIDTIRPEDSISMVGATQQHHVFPEAAMPSIGQAFTRVPYGQPMQQPYNYPQQPPIMLPQPVIPVLYQQQHMPEPPPSMDVHSQQPLRNDVSVELLNNAYPPRYMVNPMHPPPPQPPGWQRMMQQQMPPYHENMQQQEHHVPPKLPPKSKPLPIPSSHQKSNSSLPALYPSSVVGQERTNVAEPIPPSELTRVTTSVQMPITASMEMPNADGLSKRVMVPGVGPGTWYSSQIVNEIRQIHHPVPSMASQPPPPSQTSPSFPNNQMPQQNSGHRPSQHSISATSNNAGSTALLKEPPPSKDQNLLIDSNHLLLANYENVRDPGFPPLQMSDFTAVDRYARGQRQMDTSLPADQIASRFLCKQFTLEVDRVRAIYCWIADTISWDYKAERKSWGWKQKADKEDDESAFSVLRKKKSRRDGWAILFDTMAKAVGIECGIVKGYIKGFKDDFEGNARIPESNHAWNYVKISGEYRFIDIGLASPTYYLNDPKRDIQFHYFMTLPKDLIYTHYPFLPEHQFLRPVVSFEAFNTFPFVLAPFFEFAGEFTKLSSTILKLRNDETETVILKVKEGISGYAEVELPDGDKLPALTQCEYQNDQRLAKILVRMRGENAKGYLKIYLTPKENLLTKEKSKKLSTLPLAVVLKLRHTGYQNPPEFCTIFPTTHEFIVQEPLNADLRCYREYRFLIKALSPISWNQKVALKTPSNKEHEFKFNADLKEYELSFTPKEPGIWLVTYMADREGKRNIALYRCSG